MGSVNGALKARKVREKKVRIKIQSAINILALYGGKLTVRSLADEAGISTRTSAIYLREIKTKTEVPTKELASQ